MHNLWFWPWLPTCSSAHWPLELSFTCMDVPLNVFHFRDLFKLPYIISIFNENNAWIGVCANHLVVTPAVSPLTQTAPLVSQVSTVVQRAAGRSQTHSAFSSVRSDSGWRSLMKSEPDALKQSSSKRIIPNAPMLHTHTQIYMRTHTHLWYLLLISIFSIGQH